jgi:Secretion system C-terminal sorting domain
MKQYIKKALWIIPFLYSLNLSATTYYFVGTVASGTYGVGNALGNWNTNPAASPTTSPTSANGNPTTFSGTHLFYFNGKNVDLAGMTFSSTSTTVSLEFSNNTGTSNVINTGTVTFTNSAAAPLFTVGTGSMNLDFESAGTFIYNNNSTGGTQFVARLAYNNLTITGRSRKIIYNTSIKGKLTTTGSNNITIELAGNVTFKDGLSYSLSTSATTKFEITSLGGVTDNRTSNNEFLGIWYVKYDPTDGGNITPTTNADYHQLTGGSYAELHIDETAVLNGNLYVDDLFLDNQSVSMPMNYLILNSKTVEINNSVTQDPLLGLIESDNNATIICNGIATIYFNQSNTTSKTIKALSVDGGGELTLGNDVVVDSDISFVSGNINLNNNTLTIKGTVANSIGSFIGSSSSNLICSTANVGSIYFDQSTSESSTLQNLTLANGASCSLGSDLILANGVDLGTSNLTIGSNTLTFAGSSATWITRNGGQINTTGGTIEYAQTSIAGTNHSIDLSAYYTSTAGVPLNNFTVNFANACSFTPPTATDMTIGGTLNLNGSKNTFVINGGTTLTVLGNVSSTGGKFKGSATSNMNCHGTSSLYFDQTNASTKTLKNLKIQGMSADVTLKSELIITGGSNYGSVEVTAASNKFSTGDFLTLKSDANGTARIANSPGTISGNYYAEQYFPANREYRFICAPVVGATALQWRNNGSTTSHTGLGISITGANPSSNSFDASTANKPSAFWYDETIAGSVTNVNSTGTDDPGWTSISNGNSYGLTNGKGFRVLVRGDRDIDLTKSSPSPSTTTITSYGTYPRTSGSSVVLNVTNTNRTSETNNGLNLVGNPFPSAIDWNSIALSNVDNGYATYDPVGHKYVAWNGSLGDATRYISSGQAFFVMCTNSGTGTLTVEEADKYDGKGGNFFLEKLSNHMRINLMYDSTYNSDAFIHFRDDASDVKDVYDIQQFYVNGTNIASLDKNGKPYKINSLKTLDSLTVVPLSIAGTPEASLKLSFYDIPSFYGYKLELVDTYLKKTVEITEAMIYNLDITSDSFTVKDGRFYINIAKIPGLKNRSFESNKIANIYPNPIQDKMAIRLDKKITQANYEIFNSIGQMITKGTIESPESTINTSSYSNGTYYLIVKTNNSSQTIQFVK